MSTPKDFQGLQIAIGKGGGITGEVVAYYLFRNGKVFVGKDLAEKNYDKYGRISRGITTQIFESYSTLHLEDISFHKRPK